MANAHHRNGARPQSDDALPPKPWSYRIGFALLQPFTFTMLGIDLYFLTHWQGFPHFYPTNLALAIVAIIFDALDALLMFTFKQIALYSIVINVAMFIGAIVAAVIITFDDYNFGDAPSDDPRRPILAAMSNTKTLLIVFSVVFLIARIGAICMLGAYNVRRKRHARAVRRREAQISQAQQQEPHDSTVIPLQELKKNVSQGEGEQANKADGQ